ncbi:MFS transporter [Bifidobacterium tsurumiense]|uniref:Transport protein n=1 Tax=Bifidobacterium tsurumiense TaxID=356829 RepID=A0A087EJY9_9BIFI|nr:MFS transporter [Bifidobacterium tsurumiense]KFJ08090.1 transport protein [Bifidobacterium tsurumiense]MDY4677636.1 MFS transporter [Bifidobacterium tsurumiense]MSS13033.1 MFS transporter [Bifidobacterium tsurumiense]
MSQNLSSTTPQTAWLRNVILLIGGQFISLFGSSLVQYAIWWDLAIRSNSGVTIMWATIFGMLPQAFISIFGGAWADRFSRRLLIVSPDAVIAGITLCLAIAYATGNAQTWFVFVVLFVRSVGAGIQSPAVGAFIPEITPSQHLMRVNSLNGTLQSLLNIVAPAISAVLIGRFALQSVLFVDVFTAIIGIGCILLIRVESPQEGQATSHSTATLSPEETEYSTVTIDGSDQEHQSAWADIRDGILYSFQHPTLRRMLIGFTLACLICASPTMLSSIFVNRNFAETPFDLGIVQLTSITDKLGFFELTFGIGMVVGGMIMTAWGGFKRRLASLGIGIAGTGIANIIMGLSANTLMNSMWVYVISFVLFGLLIPLMNAPTFTYIQEYVPPTMQGRVFGLVNASISFSMPFGMLFAGPLADFVPIEWIFIVSGIITVVAGIWTMWPTGIDEEAN